MSLEKMNGNLAFGGRFLWETTYTEDDWRVQHHRTSFLHRDKPYRLLDPENHLIASADNEKELIDYLNHIMEN